MHSRRSLGLLVIAASLALLVSLAAAMPTVASDGDDSLSMPPKRAELKDANLGSRLEQLVDRVEVGEASARGATEDTSVRQRLAQPPLPGAAPRGSFTTDREDLAALYNATDGDNWTNNDNWLSDAPLDEWYGVFTGVTPAGNVQLTGLDLAENRLSGEIPLELGNLAHLEALSLRDNQLTGEIPAQLSNLYNLNSVHLAGNQLTGCLPANWQDVPSNDFGDAGLPFCEASSPESLPSETEKRPASTANSSSGASTMYWADQGTDRIQRADLDGSRVEDVVTSLPPWVRSSRVSGPNDIALDVAAGKIYWTVWDGTPAARNKIQRANLDGSRVEDLVTALPGVRKPNGLALDLSAGKIYWTNTFDDDEQGTGKIQRANLDGSQIEDLVTSGLGWPIGISLDAAAGKMYWTDTHANKIQRANLDGSQVEDLITSGLDVPANMALEVATGKMYWTNYQSTRTGPVPGSGEILRANLDGSQVENLVTSGLDRPDGLALDVAAGKMYWADKDKSKIQRGNLDGSRVEDLITSGLDRPSDIALYVPDAVAPPPPAGACFQALGALTAAVTRNASWTGACASTHRDGRYARFYSFTLNQRTEVEINLTSSQDTFLYLLRGSDANGAVVTDNDDIESGNTNSRITETLAAGTYTVEATTYNEGVTGSFTLEVGLHSSPGPVSLDAVLFSAGTLNGQRLSTVTPSLSVTPGQAISGTVHIAVQNDHRPGAIFPVGATPTWGDHQGSYWSIDHSAPSFSTTPYEVPVALTAPSTPGVYAIVFAAAPETSLAHVMSATRWYSGPPRWDNGDDIAGWDASRVNFAMANGYVIAPSYPEEAYHFGAAAVRIVVNPTVGPPPPSADSCFQSLGALTAAVTRSGAWTEDCASTHRGGRHARFYSFTLSQQGEVEINLTSSQDTFLYLLRGADANGAEVTNNDDVETGNTNSRITRTLAAGTYTIEATTYGEGVTGDFTLSIVPAGATAPPPSADSCFQSLGALTAAVTRSGAWTGDCASTHRGGHHARFYSFTLSQQGEVEINLTSSQDTFLYLLRGADANGAEVTNNDDVETGNTNSRITRTLAAGTYTIEATTYGEGVTGDFTLSIVPAGATAPPPSADSCFQSLGALTAAVTRSSAWTGDCASTHRGGRHARFYSFTLSQQGEVEINLTSTQDTFLYLLRGADANGAEVTNNDDVETGNTNSRITRTLAAGTYTIEATTYGEGVTGDFTLSIVPAGATAPPPPPQADACEYVLTAASPGAPPGEGVPGQWTGDCASTNQPGSYARYYTFTLDAASEVTITLESSVDTFLYLLEGAGTGGTVVAENDDVESGNTNSQVREFLAAGTYTIEATTYTEGVTGEFTLTVTVVTVTVVPTSEDREALVALYHATGGSNWRDAHNWLGTAPLDQWYGVTTDSSDRVTELALSFNGLIGQLPPELGNIYGLTRLDLSDNQLNGQIPPELGGLSSLEELDLWFNKLSGPLPPELGNLSNLKDLNLWHNRLSGRIPGTLGNLSNLTYLGLGTNQLSGSIPPELGRLGNLTGLSLSDNRLTGEIPPELGDLSNLASLYLSGNQLTGCIPEGLQNVANNDFASLDLPFCASGNVSTDREALVALYHATNGRSWTNNRNWLSNAPLGQWYGVTTDSSGRVTELDLHDNGLVGRIPSELGDLSGLAGLFMHQNQLSGGIPASLGSLSNLTWLVFHTNQLSGRVPSELGNLSNLAILSLGYNQLSGGIPTELGTLTQLRNLTLRGNRLSGLVPTGLGRLSNLGGLYLDGNQLSGQIPSQLGNLSNLEHLHLNHNRLSGAIPAQLGNLSNLTWVLFSGNQLTGCIPDGLQDVANNDFAALGLPFCGAGSPDLIVNRASVSESNPDAGAFFTLYAQVHNQGDGASTATTLRYYRSDNDTISTSDTEVGRNDIVPLGASETWPPPSIGVTAPSSAGTYYYGACVDPVPGESNTQNNCSTADTVIVDDSGNPDLVVQSASVSDNSLDAGQSFTFSATVRNQGDGPAAATTLRYYRSTNPSISSQLDIEVATDRVGSLPASRTSSESVGLTAPSSAGTYYYGACVDPVPGESNTQNNCSTADTVIVDDSGNPDLVVQSASVSDSSLDAGQSFTLSATVRNQGDGPAAATTLRYYRSTNPSISSQLDIEVATDRVGSLPASRTSSESVGLTAPSSAGTYYYGACVDPVPGESNTQNNCSTADTVIVDDSGNPDLVVQSASVSDSSLDAGQSFTLSATVRNQGDGPAAATTLRYYRSTNPSISSQLDIEVATDRVGSLPASRTSSESVGLTAPSSAGTYYYYGACVDPVPGESNPNNNCSGGERVTVTEVSPDLVVQSASVSDNSLGAGQSFTFSATVRNQGDGPAAATTLRYYRSTDPSISSQLDIEVATDRVGSLPASRTSSESVGLTAPSSAGTYYYGACVDPVPGESNPNNNCSGGERVTVTEVSPDLVVQSASVSDNSLGAGQSFTFSATVRNQGDGPAAATTLRYYLSRNSSISNSLDVEVGSDPVGSLPASRTSSESVGLTAPSSAGTYYYGACVDPVPGESNPNNNCSGGERVTVTEVSPDLVVQSVSVSDRSLDAGQSFLLSATVRNQGDGRSPGTTLRYFLSVNSSISAGGIDTEIGSDPVPNLPASGTRALVLIVTAPLDGGTYYYGACVDPVPGESDPHNNCSSGERVTVTEVSPDLIVIRPFLRDERGLAAPLTSDISVDPGAPFTLYATAHNQGDGPSNSTTLRYYRSDNDTISTRGTPVGTDSVDSLPADAINNEWIDLYAPSTPGTYYYGACVDSVSGETDTGNNCSAAVEVTVPPVRVTHKECTHTSNLFGRTYTLTGTVVASRFLSNATITGYIVRYANEREVDRDKVGEYDFGSMSANQPENFEMSKFFLFNIRERQGCDFEFEWEY